MIEVVTVDAVSTIRLLELISALYPMLVLIHVFLDNARYHHAKLVQAMARPARLPDQAAFHPAILPAFESDRAALGRHAQSMSPTINATRHVPNSPTPRLVSCAKRFPETGPVSGDLVTDNFRVIKPADFRVNEVNKV